MSEATISNLIITAITALVTVALAAITAWKTAKLGAHSGATEAMVPVANQLQANSEKLEDQGQKIDSIHIETNSALEDYRKLIRDETVKAVATALQQGYLQGIEAERVRREEIEKTKILDAATAAAVILKSEEGK